MGVTLACGLAPPTIPQGCVRSVSDVRVAAGAMRFFAKMKGKGRGKRGAVA